MRLLSTGAYVRKGVVAWWLVIGYCPIVLLGVMGAVFGRETLRFEVRVGRGMGEQEDREERG